MDDVLRSFWLLMIIGAFCSSRATASIAIPKSLSSGEQELVLETLGFGTSFKPVDNPYPLGGYSGFEAGLGFENISAGDVAYYGAKADSTPNFMYPRLTLGKGIYGNFDLFFSFIPYNESTGVGIYSGALRWGFFQATFVPACFSLLVSATNANFNNQLYAQTYVVDLITGVNVDAFSFYVGAGSIYGQGQFEPEITDTLAKTNQTARTFHSVIGANFSIAETFTALEVDTYNNTTFTFKVGVRL